jgi:glycosyltransferase 2 family protein
MRKTSWRIAQAVVGAALLYFLARRFLENWHKVQDQPAINWDLHWEFIVASLIVTWAMYGVLIWGWRTVLEGWREWIRIVDAARIWTISSLGSYIPGKVWSIAGMALMARQRGVSGTAATGSAVIMQLISIATGAMIALALVGAPVLDRVLGGWGITAAIALGSITLVAAVTLTSPSITRRLGFLLGRPDGIRPVEPSALAGALFANLVAWGGYGIALQLLALGTLHDVDLSWSTATGAFAASYVTGYVFLFLPAGLGVREFVMIAILAPTIGPGRAAALAAVSRVVLTINQVGAAVPFLLFRRQSRVIS